MNGPSKPKYARLPAGGGRKAMRGGQGALKRSEPTHVCPYCGGLGFEGQACSGSFLDKDHPSSALMVKRFADLSDPAEQQAPQHGQVWESPDGRFSVLMVSSVIVTGYWHDDQGVPSPELHAVVPCWQFMERFRLVEDADADRD